MRLILCTAAIAIAARASAAGAEDLCARHYLTKQAVAALCASGDGPGVASLVEKDNACRRSEADEIRQARLATTNLGGFDELKNLIQLTYHSGAHGAYQAAVDSVCWSIGRRSR